MIFIEGDVRNITNVLTAWRTIEEDFNREGIKIINDLSMETALQTFAEFADRRAAADAPGLGHMYEWGQLGEEAGRLFRLIATGTGNTKVATFDYKRAENPTPRGTASGDTRDTGHVFRWKAPIMELGIRTVQSPVSGPVLAIPTKEPVNYNGGSAPETGGTMWFSRQSVTTTPDFAARGSFTQMWLTYFGAAAIKVVEQTVVETAEAFLDKYETIYKKFPAPKVSPKPMSPKLLVKSTLGETYGHRKNGEFMNKMEKAAQLLRAQRVADGLA